MHIASHHYYQLTMKAGNAHKTGRCSGLGVQELSHEEASQLQSVTDGDSREPTHILSFYDFENRRTYSGWIKEDSQEKFVFELGKGKEYEFRPLPIPSQ